MTAAGQLFLVADEFLKDHPKIWNRENATKLARHLEEEALRWALKTEEADAYCVPWEAGLASTARAVGVALGKVLSTLGLVDTRIVHGPIVEEAWSFRIEMHERLKAQGWRISQKGQSGWQVLPPIAARKRLEKP